MPPRPGSTRTRPPPATASQQTRPVRCSPMSTARAPTAQRLPPGSSCSSSRVAPGELRPCDSRASMPRWEPSSSRAAPGRVAVSCSSVAPAATRPIIFPVTLSSPSPAGTPVTPGCSPEWSPTRASCSRSTGRRWPWATESAPAPRCPVPSLLSRRCSCAPTAGATCVAPCAGARSPPQLTARPPPGCGRSRTPAVTASHRPRCCCRGGRTTRASTRSRPGGCSTPA